MSNFTQKEYKLCKQKRIQSGSYVALKLFMWLVDDGRARCRNICDAMKKSKWENKCCGQVFFANDCEFIPDEEFITVMQ
jgi:hypothetical protein